MHREGCEGVTRFDFSRVLSFIRDMSTYYYRCFLTHVGMANDLPSQHLCFSKYMCEVYCVLSEI